MYMSSNLLQLEEDSLVSFSSFHQDIFHQELLFLGYIQRFHVQSYPTPRVSSIREECFKFLTHIFIQSTVPGDSSFLFNLLYFILYFLRSLLFIELSGPNNIFHHSRQGGGGQGRGAILLGFPMLISPWLRRNNEVEKQGRLLTEV